MHASWLVHSKDIHINEDICNLRQGQAEREEIVIGELLLIALQTLYSRACLATEEVSDGGLMLVQVLCPLLVCFHVVRGRLQF